MHQQNAGMSPSYPQMMPPNANFGPPGYQQFRPPFPQQQQPPFNVQQQQMMMQQRMGGHGSPMAAPTPPQPPGRYAHFAPRQGAPQHPMGVADPNAQRPGSVAPASNSGQLMPRPGSTTNPMTAPSPFGSPATAQQPIGSVGAPIAAQRTPSMPPNSLVGQRSEVDQSKIDEILAIFQNVKTRNITVLLRDTVADLFYDSVFDACPILLKELDDINAIQSRQQQDPTFRPDYWNGLMARGTPSDCSCGFSAVRHRYLCGTKGLFLDDIREALGGNPFIRSFVERNRRKGPLLEFVDCLRFLSASRNLATAFAQATYLGDLPDSLERPPMYPPQDMGRPKALPDAKFHPVDLKSDYVVSRMDDEEMNIAMRFSLESAAGRPPKRSRGLLHNWGYQLANGVREPKDQEYMAVVREVQGVLEHAMKEAVKSSQDDDSYKPEQIPQILVSADRDPIATNPQLVHMWEKLTMGPYDQAKDVLYVAVVPDSTVVVEKCKIFLEELSTVYEKCRFGRHVKLATRDAPRDGIIRVSMKSTAVQEQMVKASEDNRRVQLRMIAYFDAVLHELIQAITHRDHIFERRAYFETLYRDSLETSYTTLASNSDDTNMPPPQIRAPLSTGIGAHASPPKLARAAWTIMMKTFNTFLGQTPPHRRPQIQLELVNLQTLYDYAGFVSDPLREDRQLLEPIENLTPGQAIRSTTACAASPSPQQRPPNQPLYFRVPTAPFVLAPMEVIGVEGQNQKIRLLNPTERVLFVSYCLTEDDFLCASGDRPPNDPNAPPQRYKNRNQINDAIQRLWLWIQSVLIMETRNWRLFWAQILSKSSLRMFNSTFRGRDRGDQAGGLTSAGLSSSFSSASNCRTCAATCSTQELPIILSACLLSMEAEPNFRLFISSTAVMDAAAGGKSKTPLRSLASIDSSITHIIAFPTSPEISTDPLQHNQNVPDDDLLFGEDIMGDAFDGGDLGDLVDATELNDGLPTEITIDHQPMAVGYVVSTAGASELPSWFWNTCPNAKRHLPVHLKNSLHINSSNVHEELSLGGKSGEEAYHPLDEQGTDVLLKHVMKMHNNLSWLNVDVANGSRHSCLPVHMQCLFRLYRSVQSIQS
ncbi:Mediator of RNA polymerase II transcription subunit 13 [Aphelenchoides fujianensis]|nr:Mediator of RNA polymerase II transcription subunit 13 [Aphelenchoides fujianensis]